MRLTASRPVRLGASFLVPAALAALLGLVREQVTTAAAVLVLVLAVVAAASTGDRAAGVVAAASSALGFDVFLTRPYLRLTIADRDDVEVAVLLLAVGLVVTEIALWGRRQQHRASEHAGLVDGIAGTLALIEADDPDRVYAVAQRVRVVLGVDAVGYDRGPVEDQHPVLELDGTVVLGSLDLQAEERGLPVDDHLQVPLGPGAGRFLVSAATRVHRPTLVQRQAAAALARQLGPVLAPRVPER